MISARATTAASVVAVAVAEAAVVAEVRPVVSMTDADIADVAAFLAGQGPPRAGAPVATAAVDKVATCAACHGEAGISPAPTWPNLAGQYADYLEHAIRQYKTGERKDPVMGAQAQGIKDEDIRLIAAHFAAQSGLYTVDYAD